MRRPPRPTRCHLFPPLWHLSRGCRLHPLDLPGHRRSQRSPVHHGPHSHLLRRIRRLKAWVKSLNIAKATASVMSQTVVDRWIIHFRRVTSPATAGLVCACHRSLPHGRGSEASSHFRDTTLGNIPKRTRIGHGKRFHRKRFLTGASRKRLLFTPAPGERRGGQKDGGPDQS